MGSRRKSAERTAGIARGSGQRKRNDREQRQPGVKKRENPKKPASIEDAEIVLGPTGIEKNAANQKSGKDEEQVHTGPAKTEGATEAIKELPNAPCSLSFR